MPNPSQHSAPPGSSLNKLARLVLSLSLVASLLSGCGSGGDSESIVLNGGEANSTGGQLVTTEQPVVVAQVDGNPIVNSGSDPSLRGGIVPRRLLVKFRQPTGGVSGRFVSRMRAGESLPILAQQTGVDTQVVETIENLNIAVLEIQSDDTVSHTQKVFNGLPDVEYAEPDLLYQIHDNAATEPTDFFYDSFGATVVESWGLQNDGATDVPGNANYPEGVAGVDSQACDAWATTKGNGVVICVIDTGLNTTHVDFASAMWTNPGEIAGNNLDDDGNGYTDDINGINPRFDSTADGDITDEQGHGSNVSSIAMARENGLSCVGVAPEAEVMTIKTGTTSLSLELSAVIKGIDYATAQAAAGQPVRVINMSLGGNDPSRALKDAIDAAAEQNILCVVSSGNDGVNLDTNPQFPAAYTSPNIVTVGAHTPDDRAAGFSNFGDLECDIFAPGGDSDGVNSPPSDYFILGAAHTNNTSASLQAGTSQAAPHVAGAAALIYADNPGISYSEVRKRLMESALPGAGAYNGLCLSNGRLDANGALTVSTTTTIFLDGATPNGGHTDSEIVLEGVGFGATAGTVGLTIGGNPTVNCTVQSWTENRVTCTIPSGVATGTGTISVTQNGGNTSNTVPFTTTGATTVYTVSQDTFAPLDFSSGTVLTAFGGVENSFLQGTFTFPSIGFDFYGASMDGVTSRITNFGVMQFNSDSSSVFNTDLPDSSTPNGVVAAFWGQLVNTPNTELRFLQTVDTFAIEWRNTSFGLPVFGGSTFIGYLAVGEGTIQLEFRGSDDTIRMHYSDITFGHPDADGGGDLTIGVEDAAGTEGTQIDQAITDGTTLVFTPN